MDGTRRPEDQEPIVRVERSSSLVTKTAADTYVPSARTRTGGDAEVVVLDAFRRAPKVGQTALLEDIYPSANEISPTLSTAMRLLKEANDLLQSAKQEIDSDNFIFADDLAQRVRVLLPELFCLIDLEDGFRAIVLSTYHSLVNLAGAPISSLQLSVVKDALNRLAREPFADFDRALDVNDNYSQAGLDPDPRSLNALIEAVLPEDDLEQESDDRVAL